MEGGDDTQSPVVESGAATDTVNNNKKSNLDWVRFGLSEKSSYQSKKLSSSAEYLYTTEEKKEVQELFEHEQEVSSLAIITLKSSTNWQL